MSLLARLKYFNRERIERRRVEKNKMQALESGADVVISAPPHCMYIVKCIRIALGEIGLRCYINTSSTIPTAKVGGAHIVICPQLYEDLPARYIAYQMEQTLSSSWFDEGYINKLAAASSILDYSQSNVIELVKVLPKSVPIFYSPIPMVRQDLAPVDKGFDVAFYGNVTGSSRREMFLSQICENFRTKLIHGKHGDELYEDLRSARLIVNIHYYENAPLETTRIMECLSLGLPVVSESSRDIACYPGVQSAVIFSKEGDVEDMVAKVKETLDRAGVRSKGISDAGCVGLFYDEFKMALMKALEAREG